MVILMKLQLKVLCPYLYSREISCQSCETVYSRPDLVSMLPVLLYYHYKNQ